MRRSFRTRPLLLAASAMAVVIGGGFLILSAFVAANSGEPLTPQDVLEKALAWHDERRGFSVFREPGGQESAERLRGLGAAQAEALLAACRSPGRWTYAGEEARRSADCSRYELASCATGGGVLAVRLWMDHEKVDHLSDLALHSEFLACGPGQCPDFAVGEPRVDGVNRCETRFKVNGRVSQQ